MNVTHNVHEVIKLMMMINGVIETYCIDNEMNNSFNVLISKYVNNCVFCTKKAILTKPCHCLINQILYNSNYVRIVLVYCFCLFARLMSVESLRCFNGK